MTYENTCDQGVLSFQNENNTGSVKVKAAWDGLGLAQVSTRVSLPSWTHFQKDTLPGGHAWSQQGSGSACGGQVTGFCASVHCVLGAVLNAGCCSWWGLLADGQYESAHWWID